MNKGIVAAVAAAAGAVGLLAGTYAGGTSSTTTTALVAPQAAATVVQPCAIAPPEEQCMVPEPTTGYDLRVPLISCGVQKAYSVTRGAQILMVNAGTVPRWLEPQPLPGPPLPGWMIAPGDWWELSFTQGGTYKIIVQHSTCPKAYAQRLTFTVT